MDIHEQILMFLYEHRDKEESSDLLGQFKNVSLNLLTERIEELKKDGLIDVEYPFVGIGYMDIDTGIATFPDADKENFRKAKLTAKGIEYVKNEIIRQTEITVLIKQKENDDKKKYRVNVIISIAGVLVLIYSVYQVDRTNSLEKELIKVEQEKPKLLTTKDSLHNLLETRDKEIREMKKSLDSLHLNLKVEKKKK